MNLDHLREFVYLTRTLSFRETARHFYLSQSVLSKHIASLEDELGAQLFVRDSHHVRMTAEGKTFSEDAQIILGDYERALLNIAAVAENRKSVLRIGYLRGAARPVLKELIHYLDSAYPEYAVKLRSLEYEGIVENFALNLIDLAITMDFGDMAEAQASSIALYRDEMRVIMAPSHPLAACEHLTSDLLVGHHLLLPDREGYRGMRDFVDELLPDAESGCKAETYFDVDTLFMKVQNQEYIGFSSTHHLLRSDGRMLFRRLEDRDASYDVCLFVKKSLSSAATAACIDIGEHCAAYLRNHAAEYPLGPMA